MAPRRCNVDNEAGLRKMLESVLDSDCEYSELSDDVIESVECVSNSDSSSNASSSNESDNKNDAIVLRSKNDSDWNLTESDNNPVINSFTDNSGVCENLMNKFDSDPPSEFSIFAEFMEPLFDKICSDTNAYAVKQLYNSDIKKTER
ncbi:hypothetical protein C0J52_03845 [Blattella germanica]|nr:hypothetical protein C0J52_03845 [Blattella germanica]